MKTKQGFIINYDEVFASKNKVKIYDIVKNIVKNSDNDIYDLYEGDIVDHDDWFEDPEREFDLIDIRKSNLFSNYDGPVAITFEKNFLQYTDRHRIASGINTRDVMIFYHEIYDVNLLIDSNSSTTENIKKRLTGGIVGGLIKNEKKRVMITLKSGKSIYFDCNIHNAAETLFEKIKLMQKLIKKNDKLKSSIDSNLVEQRLIKLKRLFENDLITKDDFEKRKNEIIKDI